MDSAGRAGSAQYPALGIKQVETRVRTDPEPAAAVHVQNVDAVVAERGRIVRILAEMSELAGRDVPINRVPRHACQSRARHQVRNEACECNGWRYQRVSRTG